MSTLATVAPRLADLPAAAVFALATIAPTKPAVLAAVRIRPAAAAGRVLVEAFASHAVAWLEVEGEAARPVIVPRWALLELRRRHRSAEQLAVETYGQGLRLVTVSDRAACAVVCGEAAELPELPTWAPLQGKPAGPLLLDPALLAQALAAMREASPGPVQLRQLGHPVLGVEVLATGAEVSGSVAVARMLATTASDA